MQLELPVWTEGDDVGLFHTPYVPGTREPFYFGPTSQAAFVPDVPKTPHEDHAGEWETAALLVFNALHLSARLMRSNAIVGLEVTLDPWSIDHETGRPGVRIHAAGTIAQLSPF